MPYTDFLYYLAKSGMDLAYEKSLKIRKTLGSQEGGIAQFHILLITGWNKNILS